MKSRLVIGCKSCLEEIKNKCGYTINNKGLLRTPILANTAYTVHELYELFFENYTCPFCEETLKITPKMMEFANDFIDRDFHIIFHEEGAEIINDKNKFFLKKSMDNINLEDINTEELNLILNVVGDIDLSKWTFYIESTQVNPYYVK